MEERGEREREGKRERGRKRDREKERETERKRERQRERERDREKEREGERETSIKRDSGKTYHHWWRAVHNNSVRRLLYAKKGMIAYNQCRIDGHAVSQGDARNAGIGSQAHVSKCHDVIETWLSTQSPLVRADS